MEKIHEDYFNPSLLYVVNDYVLIYYPQDYTTIESYYCKIVDIDVTNQYLCSTIGLRSLWISENEIIRLLTIEEIQTYNSLKI